MSKFYELCKQVDSYLTEQDGSNLPSFDEAQPGEAVQQDVTIDPTTDTEVRDVSNEKIRELIQTMVNFFKDGKIIWDKATIEPLGIYWESLHPKNRWGGHFSNLVDCPHFERNV